MTDKRTIEKLPPQDGKECKNISVGSTRGIKTAHPRLLSLCESSRPKDKARSCFAYNSGFLVCHDT